MEFSESKKAIFEALHTFRTKVKQPAKNANNPFFKSKYVTLDGVVKSIDAALEGTGLSYIQEAVSEGNQVSVSTAILHKSGEYIIFDSLSVPVSKNDAQAFGSAETYARRYALSAAFGITSEEDDDGNSASANSPKNNVVKKPVKQTQAIVDLKRSVESNCEAIAVMNKVDIKNVLIKAMATKDIKDSYKDLSETQLKLLDAYLRELLEYYHNVQAEEIENQSKQ